MDKVKNFVVLMLSLLVSVTIYAKDDETQYLYEIESYNGHIAVADGYCLIKVWNYGKREKLTRDNCSRNAIHGILFKGYSASGSQAYDQGKKPLVPEGYDAHKKYFDDFFESGDYLQYVQITNNGQLSAGDVIKIDKKQYKVGMVVQVNYEGLRDRLEKDNIIKSLDFLFK